MGIASCFGSGVSDAAIHWWLGKAISNHRGRLAGRISSRLLDGNLSNLQEVRFPEVGVCRFRSY